MASIPGWTYVFYIFAVVTGGLCPLGCIYSIWRVTENQKLLKTTESSRMMYVDVAKTLITASGIAVALLAAASTRFTSGVTATSMNTGDIAYAKAIVATSAKVSAVCLIACVCSSLFVILALVRGFEMAQARQVQSGGEDGWGILNTRELRFIIVPSGVALPCFVIGFLFLGRMIFHLF